jgi:pimeloyl-ACP methyl ester carboxylesterase
VRGQGDPIVFVPALGRGVDDFDDLSKRLVQAGYQAILPDPRGIGGSRGPLIEMSLHDMATDVATVIQSLGGGRPATVVGHALGNRVARMLASDYPNLVKQVILLAPGGIAPPASEITQAGARVLDPTVPREDRLAALQHAFFAHSNDARIWEHGWYFDIAPAQRATMNRTPLADWWSGGVAPILVLQGKEDINAVPENAERLAAEFPNRVTVVEIPDSGHAMLPEQPERIATAILTYLRRPLP